MCQVLEVSKSGFYKWQATLASGQLSELQTKREKIKQKIAQSYYVSQGIYGNLRIHEDLEVWGYSPYASGPLAAI